MRFPANIIKRQTEEAMNRKGMIVGLPKVTLDCSHVLNLLKYVEHLEAEVNRLKAAPDERQWKSS